MIFERIKTLCAKNNTSPTALCKETTGSSGNLPTWKKDNIKPEWLTKLAQYFNVSTDYLLGLTDHERSLNERSLPPELEKIVSAIYETDLPLSDEELNEIIDYIHFIREKRKKKQDIPNIQPPSIQQEYYAIGRHGGQVKVTQEEIDELEKIKPLDKKI